MVGHLTLTQAVEVRALFPQPNNGDLSVVVCTSRCDRDSMSSILIGYPNNASVAQWTRVVRFERIGRGFESFRGLQDTTSKGN